MNSLKPLSMRYPPLARSRRTPAAGANPRANHHECERAGRDRAPAPWPGRRRRRPSSRPRPPRTGSTRTHAGAGGDHASAPPPGPSSGRIGRRPGQQVDVVAGADEVARPAAVDLERDRRRRPAGRPVGARAEQPRRGQRLAGVSGARPPPARDGAEAGRRRRWAAAARGQCATRSVARARQVPGRQRPARRRATGHRHGGRPRRRARRRGR